MYLLVLLVGLSWLKDWFVVNEIHLCCCSMIVTRLADLEESIVSRRLMAREWFVCCALAASITDRIHQRQFSELWTTAQTRWPLGSMASFRGFGRFWCRLYPLPPNVENSGNMRSLESRLSSSGRLFWGVKQAGGVAVGLEVPGTTTQNGLFPNLAEWRPSVAAGPISGLKWWWCGIWGGVLGRSTFSWISDSAIPLLE